MKSKLFLATLLCGFGIAIFANPNFAFIKNQGKKAATIRFHVIGIRLNNGSTQLIEQRQVTLAAGKQAKINIKPSLAKAVFTQFAIKPVYVNGKLLPRATSPRKTHNTHTVLSSDQDESNSLGLT